MSETRSGPPGNPDSGRFSLRRVISTIKNLGARKPETRSPSTTPLERPTTAGPVSTSPTSPEDEERIARTIREFRERREALERARDLEKRNRPKPWPGEILLRDGKSLPELPQIALIGRTMSIGPGQEQPPSYTLVVRKEGEENRSVLAAVKDHWTSAEWDAVEYSELNPDLEGSGSDFQLDPWEEAIGDIKRQLMNRGLSINDWEVRSTELMPDEEELLKPVTTSFFEITGGHNEFYYTHPH